MAARWLEKHEPRAWNAEWKFTGAAFVGCALGSFAAGDEGAFRLGVRRPEIDGYRLRRMAVAFVGDQGLRQLSILQNLN
jgi:hypothetical protein